MSLPLNSATGSVVWRLLGLRNLSHPDVPVPCYQKSASMTCSTCHDHHKAERGRTQLFEARCQQCHEPADCGGRGHGTGQESCIDCHMPLNVSKGLKFDNPGERLVVPVRNHRIGVYRD